MKYIQRLNKSLNMKLILPALIIILFTSCSSKQKNDIENEGINGSVSKITLLTYDASEKFGEVQKGRLSSSDVQEVNDDGNVFKSTYTSFYNSSDDSIPGVKKSNYVFITLTKFNDKKQKIAFIDGKNNRVKSKYTYNSDGKISEINDYSDGKLSSKTKYSFVDGHLSESKQYYPDGSLNEIIKYKMGDDGWAVEEKKFSAENEFKGRMTFSFKDNLIMGYNEYKGNTLDDAHEFKYAKFDNKKNWIVQYRYRNNEIESVVERKLTYK